MIAYLRATLTPRATTTHPLQAEFDRLRDYLELMAIRMGRAWRHAGPAARAGASMPVPTLLLQPLVENSIQHGLEPKVEGGRIAVQRAARRRAAGAGGARTPASARRSAPAGGKGFGLAQVRERLAALHGAAAALDLQPHADGGARTHRLCRCA